MVGRVLGHQPLAGVEETDQHRWHLGLADFLASAGVGIAQIAVGHELGVAVAIEIAKEDHLVVRPAVVGFFAPGVCGLVGRIVPIVPVPVVAFTPEGSEGLGEGMGGGVGEHPELTQTLFGVGHQEIGALVAVDIADLGKRDITGPARTQVETIEGQTEPLAGSQPTLGGGMVEHQPLLGG